MRTVVVGLMAFFVFSCAAKFKCSAPLDTGLECRSITEVYSAYTGSGDMTGKVRGKKADIQVGEIKDSSGIADIVKRLEVEGKVPLRVPPKVVRIWIAPFEDEDGDLNQGGYVYMEISSGRKWIIGEKLETEQKVFSFGGSGLGGPIPVQGRDEKVNKDAD